MASVVRVSDTERLLGDRYEVLSPLGAGAAAHVYRVRDVRTGAVRAAKVLKTEHAASVDVLARFEDEFRILRTLHHPHLPEVYDYGWTANGERYLVMELVDGEPLDRYFAAHPDDIWVILYEICETLVFVHGRNLLHQDIKPSNILVTRVATPGGERPMIKVIDFGLTYRRGTGAVVQLVGTAEYVAPEVVSGAALLTRAVDYYSLGATLFELLCGAPPFTGTENEVLRAHLEREPVIEDEALEWAELYPHVRALLGKDAQKRLAAFEEFRRAVVGRLTGGIEDLDRSYALARIDSLGMIGKREAWDSLLAWLSRLGASDVAHTVSVSGSEGVGTRYLLGALRMEAAMRGIRTLTPAEIDPRTDATVARQPALMWSRLLEMCEREPVVLMVPRPSTLPDEERSFVRLAGTQFELARSRGRVLPLFFVVAVDSTTDDADVLDYLPSDGSLKVSLEALSTVERDQIVGEFRGSMFDSRDARALGTYLGRFEDAGGAIQGLQQAVLRSGLTFVGQRWKVQPSLLSEITTTRANEAFSRDLVASLSPLERSIAAVVSAHPEPVPVPWVAAFAGATADEVLSIIGGSLKRLLVASSDNVSPASASVRASLRAGSEVPEMRRAHEFLASHVARLERSATSDRALAYHYERLGAVRDAARVHLRLLQAYWSVRPRERPYELIEGVCRSGLELLEAHGGTVNASTRRHLFCFYLKQWINALWARNLFTKAKPIIDEWTKRLGEEMPASVVPRYVRSVLELEGPDAAIRLVSKHVERSGSRNWELTVRLKLERALSIHNKGDYRLSLEALDSIEDRFLSTRDRIRRQVYRAMNVDELQGMGLGQSSLDLRVEPEVLSGCFDEQVLIHALKARGHIAGGRLESALSSIALGIRVAHRSGLHFRENLLCRLAASVYGEASDLARERRAQERSLRVAGVIGIRYIVGTSWARLSQNECSLGRFGNAIHYAERAVDLMGGAAPNRDVNQAFAALYAPLVFSRMARDSSYSNEIARRSRSAKGHNERGYYSLSRARDLYLYGKQTEALEAFRDARECFERAGYRMNAVWAQLGEARIHLARYHRKHFNSVLKEVRSLVVQSSPAIFRLELGIVELKGCYVFRAGGISTVQLAREHEQEFGRVANVPLKIEMLEILTRIYGRSSLLEDIERVFGEYRVLVSEVIANADPNYSQAIAEEFLLGEMIREFRIATGRNKEGGPLVPLPEV